MELSVCNHCMWVYYIWGTDMDGVSLCLSIGVGTLMSLSKAWSSLYRWNYLYVITKCVVTETDEGVVTDNTGGIVGTCSSCV